MQEKVRLLMEETSCEQGEAELALELAGHDLEKAIRTIESLLRHIFALKGKIHFTEKNLYGLLLVVINMKSQEILRLSTVVSYNPALYEHSVSMDWYALEKLIFSYRLDEGSLPDFTQEIEQKLQACLQARPDLLMIPDNTPFETLIGECFALEKMTLTLTTEELNLAQFRQLPKDSSSSNTRVMAGESEGGAVCLQVDLLEDKNGKEVNRLTEGEVILSKIVDTRDIAHYLAHLIGSRRAGEIMPLPAVVRKVAVSEVESEVQVFYAPGILGVARIRNDLRVKVIEEKSQPWWKKIIPWS